jgi:hypothetical protein
MLGDDCLYYIFNYLPFDWFAELETKSQPRRKLGGMLSGALRRLTMRSSGSGAGTGGESKSSRK